jgi:hypothetical protein
MRPFRGRIFILFASLLPVRAAAHGVDQNDSAAFVDQRRLVRFDYANDYFTGTDRYFTQGIGLQYFDPVLHGSPLMHVLPSLSGQKSYGLIVRNSGFTPTKLNSDPALIGDRPFAATLTLGHVIVSHDADRGLTLTSRLDAGMIGQAAGGKWQQVGIHKATGNAVPHGWDNQIRNDAAVGYFFRLEKLLATAKAVDVSVYGDAEAGTLYDNAAAGISGRAGRITGSKHFYLFGRAEEKLVGYDATLQGGVFNKSSPYVLSSAQVRRSVMRADVGMVWDMDRWAVAVSRTYLSREFTGGVSHEWVELSFLRRF